MAVPAAAGPWSQIPAAVTRLQDNAYDRRASAVLIGAQQSVMAEAAAGNLAAVDVLVGAYTDLVLSLDDGELRVQDLERNAAVELFGYGVKAVDTNPLDAAAAWALAARFWPESQAVGRLRALLVPPGDPKPGQRWTSPVDGVELVWLPPLRFLFGCTPGDATCEQDEKYLAWVELPGFWAGSHEVTAAQYLRCVAAHSCEVPNQIEHLDPSDLPMVNVSWYDAQRYAHWLGRQLPSETMWERAARGTTKDKRFPWGGARLRGRANLHGGTGPDTFEGLSPVGSFPAGGWNLYDLAGNVWEWCEDSYHIRLNEGPKDVSAWTQAGVGSVVRGGSWRTTIEYARVSARFWQEHEYRADDLGFRVFVVPSARHHSDDWLIQFAGAAFPIKVEPGTQLAAAQLDAVDYRYLQRRAIHWLSLEQQPIKALPHALELLAREPDDPVALEFLNRLASGLVTELLHLDPRELNPALARYRSIASGTRRAPKQLVTFGRELARSLRLAAEEHQRQGDFAGAFARFSLALELRPSDAQLLRLKRIALPSNGAHKTAKHGQTMVWVSLGTSSMGRSQGDDWAGSDELPAHLVAVNGFWIDRTEVTNDMYRTCVAAGRCSEPGDTSAYFDTELGTHPVTWVSWFQAREYCAWADERLPSEAEWERAARAGTKTRYSWGDDWVPDAANSFSLKGRDHFSGTAPVGSFPPSALGLFDMQGNVWEWVQDLYHDSYRDAPSTGRAWTQLDTSCVNRHRGLRGGSFVNLSPKLRVSQREHRPPDDAARNVGFRCAADL